MDFRIRPSSKKSEFDKMSDRSLVDLPVPKTFQQNENTVMRSFSNRIDSLQSSFANYQEIWRKERQISNASYLDVQKRLDMMEYKTFTTEKTLKQISQFPPSALNQPKTPAQSSSSNQFNLIKQAIHHQQQMHYEHTKHQQQIDEQLNRKQMKLQQQVRELLNRQKQDIDVRWRGQVEEIRVEESVKQRKIDQQYEMMKALLNGTQRKIYVEFERKIRNETVIKDYIEDRILSLKQEMAMEQKNIISKQNKFVRQIRDSIESVLSIIQNTKKQLEEELAETQKLSATNIKRVSMSIDLLKEKNNEQFSHIITENDQILSQMSQLKNFVNHKLEENRQIIMEIQEEAMNMTSKNKSRMRSSQVSEVEITQNKNGSVRALKTEMKNWKQVTEQKNLNVFKQISSTLKTMKIDWKKENDEITSQVGSFKESLFNIKKSVPMEVKKSVQTVITIFNNQFDTLAEQLDSIIQMVALAKKQNEKYIRQQLKKVSEEILNQAKDMISVSQKESIAYTEKILAKQDQTMRSHVQNEVKFLKDTLIHKFSILETQMTQLGTSNKKNQLLTTAQLEDFTLKLKNHNEKYKDYLEEQRKDDLKKRLQLEEKMRKNMSNLMDLTYKKSEFLVQGMKKAIQMNQMKDKMELTRQVQEFREDSEKKIFLNKEELITQFNGKLEKLAEQVDESEQAFQEQVDKQISTVKRTFQLEIQSAKQELESTKHDLQTTKAELLQTNKSVEINKQQFIEEKEKRQVEIKQLEERTQQKMKNLDDKNEYQIKQVQMKNEQAIKQLDLKNEETVKALQIKSQETLKLLQESNQEDLKKIEQRMKDLQDKGHEQTEQLESSVTSLRETMWKMEAMTFSQQAKNKAIFDRMGDDINQMSTNMSVLAKQMKYN